MTKKETEESKSEIQEHGDTPPDNALKGNKSFLNANKLETVVAILLGITTLLSAWATWIGSLHSGIQSINFTKSNNMASQGTAEYNMGMQLYLSDYMAWNAAKDYYYDLELAKAEGNQAEIDILTEKIERFKKEAGSVLLREAVEWMEKNNADDPFTMPGMAEKYFESAQDKVNQSQGLLEEGMRDNTKGDSYNLVTVIFSLTLFLLGIIGTFKNMPNRLVVLSIAVLFLIFAVIYMCTIPLPTGFGKMNFFEFNQ
ncbi:MAG: hypothetical protein IJS27_01700 [Ruminococcus sp.]|nr:hypothetical protein [Ruminococcus sp.]